MVIQAAGEDEVDDLQRHRHDVNEVGRLGAHSLLMNDAVHLVYGLGGSGGLTVAPVWRTSSEAGSFFQHGNNSGNMTLLHSTALALNAI